MAKKLAHCKPAGDKPAGSWPGEVKVSAHVQHIKPTGGRPNGEYTIVTRRGYVVPMGKGKIGIHDKFDEVLNNSCDS